MAVSKHFKYAEDPSENQKDSNLNIDFLAWFSYLNIHVVSQNIKNRVIGSSEIFELLH